jgi:hypothetical protein
MPLNALAYCSSIGNTRMLGVIGIAAGCLQVHWARQGDKKSQQYI